MSNTEKLVAFAQAVGADIKALLNGKADKTEVANVKTQADKIPQIEQNIATLRQATEIGDLVSAYNQAKGR